MPPRPTAASTRRAIRHALAAAWMVGVPAALAAQRDLTGSWQLEHRPEYNRVQLTLREDDGGRRGGTTSFGVARDDLPGLTAAQLAPGADEAVRFRLARDAGTFTFDGRVAGGRGRGTFAFAPDPAFAAGLARRGYERLTDAQQLALALHDVGYPLVDELRTQGYDRPDADALVTLGTHGVDVDYVRQLGALGYRLGTTDALVRLRDHGVTPRFIEGLAAAGYRSLDADELRHLRDVGVTPEYVGDLDAAGYRGLTTRELVDARNHGVTRGFAAGFQEAGYPRFPIRQLIELRDHGVTPAFARRLRERLGRVPTARELIAARIGE